MVKLFLNVETTIERPLVVKVLIDVNDGLQRSASTLLKFAHHEVVLSVELHILAWGQAADDGCDVTEEERVDKGSHQDVESVEDAFVCRDRSYVADRDVRDRVHDEIDTVNIDRDWSHVVKNAWFQADAIILRHRNASKPSISCVYIECHICK